METKIYSCDRCGVVIGREPEKAFVVTVKTVIVVAGGADPGVGQHAVGPDSLVGVTGGLSSLLLCEECVKKPLKGNT